MVSTRNNPGGNTPAATTLSPVSKRSPSTRKKTSNKPSPLPTSSAAKSKEKKDVDCFNLGQADAAANSSSQEQIAQLQNSDGSPDADAASCPADAVTEHQQSQQIQHAPASAKTAGQPAAAKSPADLVNDRKDGAGDLLPMELLHQLQQLRQQQQQCGMPVRSHTMPCHKQKQQRRNQRGKHKHQSGPVQVAVLPLLSRSGVEQQGSSAGRGMRHQLLESRLCRSAAML